MNQVQRLQQDFEEVQRRLNALDGGSDRTTRDAVTRDLLDPQPVSVTPAKPPQNQQLPNGDWGWSVNGYYETVAAPGTDKVKEAANWFSNNSVVAGQALSFVDARTSSNNKTLKSTSHSTYDANYCDWDDAQGVARITGTKSLDAPFPTSPVFPDRTEYAGARGARRSAQIVITPDTHLVARLYDNTPGSEDVMQMSAALALTAVIRGTPGTTTERRYKVFARTDKGFTVLSAEVTLAAAPSDAAFAAGVDVYLQWPSISGAIEYKVYRHDITAAKYRLLISISTGNTNYADNNHVEAGHDDEGGYPSSTTDRVKCYAATSDGDLSNLPVNNVALEWNDLFWNIPVPVPLASAGAGHQVLRLQLDKAMDRRLSDAASTAVNKRIQSATGAFTALDTGRIATLYAADGVTVLHGPEAITLVDATHVDFATNVATTNAGVILYIVGGGDHGLLIDLLHIGWIKDAKFSEYPDDMNRTLARAASPTTSGQGGVGSGGSGSGDAGDAGVGGCITLDCPVSFYEGNRILDRAFSFITRGFTLFSANIVPNHVLDIQISTTDNLHIVRFDNGIEVPCSPGQRFITSPSDHRGTPASRLQSGDYSIVVVNGAVQQGRIAEVTATGRTAQVGCYMLAPGHSFVAGFVRRSLWQRLTRWLGRKSEPTGALLHNVKIL